MHEQSILFLILQLIKIIRKEKQQQQIHIEKFFFYRIMFDKNHVVILGIDLWEHG